MYVIDNNELYHHGIKGQKWGVRRFQNEDGSVTAKGAKRYYDGDMSATPSIKSNNTKNAEEKSEKKGLSKKQKVAIGVGIAAVAAVGAYAAGVKIADAKANKAANEKIASMLQDAKLHTDISLQQAKLAQASTNRSDFDSWFRGSAQQHSRASSILDSVNAASNSGGRKGKKVKLSKENAKALNKLVNNRNEADFRIKNLVKDSARSSRFN